MNVEITSDLKEILVKIDQKLEKLTEDNAETKVALAEIKGEVKAFQEEIKGDLKAFQEETKGNFKVLEQLLNGLDTIISNQEFTNRGILMALVVAILAGAAQLFGLGVN